MAYRRSLVSLTLSAILKQQRNKFLLSGVRHYTTEPPEWLGGKNILIKSGRFEFPEHSQTFEEKMNKQQGESEGEIESPVNIGIEHTVPRRDRSKAIAAANANRRNKELEQAARLRTLKIPLDEMRRDWLDESATVHIRTIADHYGIYQDLFGGNYFFTPVVNLNVCFDYDDEFVTPVYYGNKIPPAEAKQQPLVSYEASDETLWTLLMTNLDGHLTDDNAEYIHWLIGNIPGSDVTRGEVLVDYVQPFPAKGTGFHRFVFILFEQSRHIDYSKYKRKVPCNFLSDRTHRTSEFFDEHCNGLLPKGLSFFQSEWDDSVRQVFHHYFDMAEPTYEYAHPPPYHPPPKKYPHKEPFDRYFDRYRDKKDLAEEVLKMKLDMTTPFQDHPEKEKYPLIHQSRKYKPSWLKLREEIMHRRLEQYKDLP